MATKTKQPAKRRVARKRQSGKAAKGLMTRADMMTAVTEYTSEAIAAMMKLVRSKSSDLASVKTKVEAALRKHGWTQNPPRKLSTARKRKTTGKKTVRAARSVLPPPF